MAHQAATQHWTAPYLGVQHLESSDKRYRATLTAKSSFSELTLSAPGCGFNPHRLLFLETAHEVNAKQAAEEWLAQHAGGVAS